MTEQKEINPARVYSGVLMTSLDSSGVHISILKIPPKYNDLYIGCLDDKTDAPCWPGCTYSVPLAKSNAHIFTEDLYKIPTNGRKLNDQQINIFKKSLINACTAIIHNEETLNNLDRGCGDGDCGSTHKLLANGK